MRPLGRTSMATSYALIRSTSDCAGRAPAAPGTTASATSAVAASSLPTRLMARTLARRANLSPLPRLSTRPLRPEEAAMPRARTALLLAVALVAALLAPAGAEPPPLTSWPYEAGYVAMPDGTELRYTVFLPDTGPGPWPVLLHYDGYAAGTNPYENGQNVFGERMRQRGYAVLGVNVRGSGCSDGTFDVFEHQWALDGYQVVEWAAAQRWSNGHVGM